MNSLGPSVATAFRRTRRRIVACLATTALFAPAGLAVRTRPRSAARDVPVVVTAAVTPVVGQSWLDTKGLNFNDSSFGRRGRTGPESPAGGVASSLVSIPQIPGPGFIRTGADLYRVSCASCHGASGTGSPPEINSLIGPIQSTSPAFLQKQMRARGFPLDLATARQLGAQAEKAVRDRFEKGGERMPPFHHLFGHEVDSVLAYLQGLGGVPDVRDVRVVESVFRVGEQVVKSNCHTCHSATGQGPLELRALPGAANRRDPTS